MSLEKNGKTLHLLKTSSKPTMVGKKRKHISVLFTHKEYQDAPPVFMDDDQAPLAYYGAVNGADIFINEAKSE